jgi:hypothetical protein
VTGLSDADLYRRGVKTLLASWEVYARGCPGAAVIRSPGVAVAVFPHGPEREFLNNALLEQNLAASGRARPGRDGNRKRLGGDNPVRGVGARK